ncbi:hypothetical protein C7474_0015 [Microbacterium telephonicum]|uniref:Uncharacterized protein n=1 Tax=Microbacterium telephonicum TaxID=1714841 RepID=A0A498CA23_9MICO|nr:hypothetical protein C7474_0015 [Microbacterium telephonicum]
MEKSTGGRAAAHSADRRRTRILALDISALVVVGALLVGALGAASAVAYQKLYSPEAFVLHYLSLLSEGRAADALAVPGVAVDSRDLTDAGLPDTASEALLRQSALAPLDDVAIESVVDGGDAYAVTASYAAGPHRGKTTFTVGRLGSVGLAPTWRFVSSPLAVIDLSLRGAMQFSVNGFDIDKRQVLTAGADADPLADVPLLVFSPGLYSISVDTPVSTSPGVAVLSDKPRAVIPVGVQTEPTAEFVGVVQQEVESFLDSCTTQKVLQPTGCPFGFSVQNRIKDEPTWSMTTQPTITLEPDGAGWAIPRTEAVAHIRVDIQSIYDGSVREVDVDVPFFLTGTITMLADGSASIQVAPAD